MIRYRCKNCGNAYDKGKETHFPCKKNAEWEIIEICRTPNESQKALLENPELLNIVLQESEKKAVGEKMAKLNLIIFCMGRLVKNSSPSSFNGIPHEKSGTGKDHLTKIITSLCVPPEDLCHRSRISQALLNYWHDASKEPEWTWDGKVLFLEDVSDSILNCEVVKTFLSGGSHVSIVVNQEAKDILINGKPVCLFTTANSTPAEETLRRIQLIPLDSSIDQTKRIKKFYGRNAKYGNSPEFDKDVQEALFCLKPYKVIIPFAELIVEEFPDELIARTSVNRFFDYVRAVSILYQHQLKRDENENLIADGTVYDLARLAFTHCLGKDGGLTPLTNTQRKIIAAIQKNSLLDEISTPIHVSKFISDTGCAKDTLYSNLKKLVNVGMLKEEEGKDDYGHSASKYSVVFHKNFHLPSYFELIKGSQSQTNQTNQTNQTKPTNQTNHNMEEVNPVSLVSLPQNAPGGN